MRLRLAAVLASCLGLAAPALGQESQSQGASGGDAAGAGGTLKLELNRMENAGEGCKTYLLVDNRGTALKSIKLDLFAFDTDGVAQKRLALELGSIPEKKTMVRIFDFPGIACPKIGKILLSDVLTCEGGDSSRDTCLERIATSSKTTAEFAR